MTRQLQVGDHFRFIEPNDLGGSQFGTIGDIGEVLAIPAGVETWFSFKFISVDDKNFDRLETRDHYMVGNTRLNVQFKNVEPLVKDYRVDQEPMEDEDCL
ncbi:hypothetical protein SmphiM6_85 [Sinorhizobium phage phiM6]|nr:hypothetical protein SmphiM6_85 [Sinorhizobium phage phiM6]